MRLTGAVRSGPRPRLGDNTRLILLFAAFAVFTLVVRAPSFFEPPWHTDEGIFQAVAQRVALGGELYADAWESKPPLFIYIYVAIIEVFGAGVLPLRVVSAIAALGTELALFAVALRFMSRRQALGAAALLAVLLAVPFWEGNLALTETFAVLPSGVGVWFALKGNGASGNQAKGQSSKTDVRWLLAAGVMFGLAVLIRQTTAVAALAVVLWLMLSGGAWLRTALLLALGGAVVVLPVVAAFALFGSLYWFWDANVGFFFSYVPSGEQLPFHYRPLILLPVLAAIGALYAHRRRGETPAWGLPVLWLTLTLAAALLTGRPYSHYFLQTFAPLAMLVALIVPAIRLDWRPRVHHVPAFGLVATLVLLWMAVVRPEFGNPYAVQYYWQTRQYYPNFFAWITGSKTRAEYEGHFDGRVQLTERLDETLEELGASGESMYIWGEYPWVYSLTGAQPVTPYMTSFYVLLIPYLDTALGRTLATASPRFIVVTADVWPRYPDETGVLQRRYRTATRAINALLAERYELAADVGRARVFRRTVQRPLVTTRQYAPSEPDPEPVQASAATEEEPLPEEGSLANVDPDVAAAVHD